ncbi:DUF2207 domain-containing protein [Tessaracoccus massiliensis]|uniref:DUF2207 domain-containing protein n=1 Tax=Tessaracoccus massiliensis TaxID=1522311 RepID=UPI00058CC05E|nr:DUF2207 domain-containing protein [Tessaracoccus massiliensis]
MRRAPGSLAAAVLVSLLILLGSAAPARADEESIRHLDVTFAIQADGTVDVRYELDWHFAEKGQRGINFGIATREPWEPDPSQDVVYTVDDIKVSSPSGAPAQFTATEEGSSSTGSVNLRIGDPDVTLDTQDATYVIEYTLGGALRTFDEGPEFYWDVTSPDYPPIERFTARVTAPDGIDRARCLVGQGECTSSVDGGEAAYSATRVGGVLTVVAGFPAGSVANAEPALERRRLSAPELTGYSSDITVAADGSAEVAQKLSYEVPADEDSVYLHFTATSRVPWSEDRDQAYEFRDVEVRDEEGNRLPHSMSAPHPEDESFQVRRFTFDAPATDSFERTFTVTYRLEGAAVVDDGVARLRVQPAPPPLHTVADPMLRIHLPTKPTAVGCLGSQLNRYRDTCEFGPHLVDDQTITVAGESLKDLDGDGTVTDITFPASALPGAGETLVASLDGRQKALGRWGIAGGVATAAGLAAAGIGVARTGRRRDQRYGDVAPGLVGSPTAIRTNRRADKPPVSFTPPDLLPLEAGALRHGGYRDSHLAATLVHLAVQGAVKLGTDPLKVLHTSSSVSVHPYEAEVRRSATKRDIELPVSSARRMRSALQKRANLIQEDEKWFLPRQSRTTQLWGLAALVVLPWVVFFAGGTALEDALGPFHFPLFFGSIVGGFAGAFFGLFAFPRRARTADATALVDQIEGFEQYLATAEANQLNFEADRDIFRRYLPWAVLFDLTDRWTEVCGELAAQGKVDLDTSFLVGSMSLGDLSSGLSTFSSEVSRAASPPSSSSSSSSGGSGGSSGFSSSSSGGGGGGGTSASSW